MDPSGRVYEDGAARLGMLPGAYRRGGEGMQIHWTILETELGLALVAATERGLCSIALGDAPAELESELRGEFPNADISRVQDGRDEFLAPRVQQVARLLSRTIGQARHRIDRHRIPAARLGSADEDSTRTDAQLCAVGAVAWSSSAARAVARACAQNRLAVIVPCHRIIRGDGSLGGYRWGLPLKDELLQRERAA